LYGLDQRQQQQQQLDDRGDAVWGERELWIELFNEIRPGICSSNRKAASAEAERRPLGALSSKSYTHPHGRSGAQQQALAAAGLSRILIYMKIAKRGL
jgi:hypothetical protein